MMTSDRKDLVHRTIVNLDFVTQKSAEFGLHEVTQLINSFLAVLIINWDAVSRAWPHLSMEGISWPEIGQRSRRSPKDSIKKIRDALAHGLFTFEEGGSQQIIALYLWTCPEKDNAVDWDARVTVEDMRKILDCIQQVLEKQDIPFPEARFKPI